MHAAFQLLASGIWPSASDRKALFDPVMTFMGRGGESDEAEQSGNGESPEDPSPTVREIPSTELPTASVAGTAVSSEENEASESKVEESSTRNLETTLSVTTAES